MATFNKGILGGYSGKVGNVVGSSWRGKNVLRSLPAKGNRTFTQSQLDQQEKFGLVIKFVSTMSPLISTTFKAYGKGISAINAAVSFNLQNGISGIVPPFNLYYPNILVSRGDLPNTSYATTLAVAGNKVTFDWENNEGIGKATGADKVVLVLHCPAVNSTVYVLGGNLRSALTQTVHAPLFSGETVETWIAFISENGSTVSNSMHSGFVNMI